jgi:hypothetical protein
MCFIFFLSTIQGALAGRFALVEAGKHSEDNLLAYQVITSGVPGEVCPMPQRQAALASHAPA